jgi:hypothetical protein
MSEATSWLGFHAAGFTEAAHNPNRRKYCPLEHLRGFPTRMFILNETQNTLAFASQQSLRHDLSPQQTLNHFKTDL